MRAICVWPDVAGWCDVFILGLGVPRATRGGKRRNCLNRAFHQNLNSAAFLPLAAIVISPIAIGTRLFEGLVSYTPKYSQLLLSEQIQGGRKESDHDNCLGDFSSKDREQYSPSLLGKGTPRTGIGSKNLDSSLPRYRFKDSICQS